MKMSEIIGEEDSYSKSIEVRLKLDLLKTEAEILFECPNLEEGKTKNWGKGYTYRIDRRGNHHGGDQIHINDRNGRGWAYRDNGEKSEPNKYTTPATNIVKDIVADVFNFDRNKIKETLVISATEEKIIVEVSFV